ncbi:tyrosine-type recombinase/integrase [Ramlibacter alkalitolerans]|uniref:Tyrosine-type recombinase/integrase n=1 Tax=Ramlibacter alkalitolerans TaxID=2039631 RepID=A0ABS1JU12_9BURK|nr:tyrosine-type recombinase/integrase [Ramlibacter alkalitolerans]MBL0427789.1 tyrosine-type recombinase/integrase [Ramlibacter alkalitolerans]
MATGQLFTWDARGWEREPVAAFEAFLTGREFGGRKLRPSSFNIYRGQFLRLLTWLQEQGRALHELDAARLDLFLATRELRAETRHRYLLVFTDLYRHLGTLRRQEDNPAYELLLEQQAPEREEPEALTPDEVRAVFRALPRKEGWKHHRFRAMLWLLTGAGLRPTEILTLRSKDLNADCTSVWVMPHKPRPERTVPLHWKTRDVVLGWLAERKALGIPGELLFPANTAGAPLAASTLFRQVKKLLEEAGVSRRYEGAMLLRNTRGASWLARHPVHKVQAWLGHELERTTEQLLPASEAWRAAALLD